MKYSLTTNQAIDIMMHDECAKWTRAGARALVEYLEQLEEDTGEDIEMDLVALRCDWSEYTSFDEWAEEFGCDVGRGITDDDEREYAIRRYIQERGQLIDFFDGIIVSNF